MSSDGKYYQTKENSDEQNMKWKVNLHMVYVTWRFNIVFTITLQ